MLIISCDGKGIVMRPEALREATRRAAASGGHKLTTRLSKGEKANRKRMATVGCVHDLDPVVQPLPRSCPGQGTSSLLPPHRRPGASG